MLQQYPATYRHGSVLTCLECGDAQVKKGTKRVVLHRLCIVCMEPFVTGSFFTNTFWQCFAEVYQRLLCCMARNVKRLVTVNLCLVLVWIAPGHASDSQKVQPLFSYTVQYGSLPKSTDLKRIHSQSNYLPSC